MQSGQERDGESSRYQRHFGVPVNDVVYGTDPSPYDRLTKASNDKQHPISPLDGSANSITVAPSVWKTGWTTPACMVGFYLIALLCAAAHLAVFSYLDGRVIDDNDEKLPFPTTSVSQNYATTASLALVTAFRAALVACIGLSYTQRLWQKMRNELLEVGLIEELFQIRANALRLLNPFTIRFAPLLLCVATLSWLLPVALIYPPGALVVGLDYRSVPEKFNVSIIPPEQEKLAMQPTLEGQCTTGLAALMTINGEMNCSAFSFSDSPRIGTYPMTTSILMARTSLASSSILDLSRGPSQNASYSMKFRGPKLQCTDSQRTRTIPFEDLSAYQSYQIGQYSWLNATGRPISMYSMMHNDSTLIIEDSTAEDAFGFVPCPPGAIQSKNYNLTYSHLVQKSSMRTCVAATAEYSLNISFLNGQQRVNYSTGEVQLLPRYGQSYGKQPTLVPARSFQEYFNLRALVDSLLLNLEQPGRVVRLFTPRTNATEVQTVAWPNDSSVAEVCPLQPRSFVSTGSALPLLELSSFNRDRGKAVPRGFNVAYLDMSEKLLNEALANITISALSLNTWYGLVDGTSTRVFNVYRFENWRSFYLPYGLSLLCTIPVLILGLLALHQNGVAAIDGGFVQILMTTTGRTELEKAAIGGCLGGQENVPHELKKLKVRFGELTESPSSERTGTDFGTDADTMQSSRTGSKSALCKNAEERDQSKSNMMADEIHEENRWESIPLEEQREGKTMWTTAVAAEKPRGSQVVRRAGFGALMETSPLERGIQYGTIQPGDRA